MPQSLSRVYVHLVFSTRDRLPCFGDLQFRDEMHRYIAGICNNLDCPSIQVGGPEDHIHIGCCLGRNMKIADLVREVKVGSNRWIRDHGEEFVRFNWQKGYGVFSISESGVEQLLKYIRNQVDHHKKISFKDEFRALCRKYKIVIDERYVWD